MSFWGPAPKSSAENNIPQKSLDTSPLKWIMGIKEILQVVADSLKVSSHKNYLEIVRYLIPVKILNFWVIEVKSLFSLVNIFLTYEKKQQQVK